jgi:hypothetical protein
MLSSFIIYLAKEFSTKDLSEYYFLRIEVVKHDKGFYLSQAKYALDPLNHAVMVDCKPNQLLL